MSVLEQINVHKNTAFILLIILAITFGLGYWAGSNHQARISPDLLNTGIVDLTDEVKPIKVYICGEVKNPGVYQLNTGDCVLDAVKKAGGFNEKADLLKINQARMVKNGEQIIVQAILPSNADLVTSLTKSAVPQGSSKNNLGLININTATKEELMSLPGIGEVKALAIISYRDKNGWFSEIAELDKVNGIGPKTMETLTPLITVN